MLALVAIMFMFLSKEKDDDDALNINLIPIIGFLCVTGIFLPSIISIIIFILVFFLMFGIFAYSLEAGYWLSLILALLIIRIFIFPFALAETIRSKLKAPSYLKLIGLVLLLAGLLLTALSRG